MKTHLVAARQRGAVLIIALIMLMLITVLVSGSFSMSTVNLQSVGNMQVRQEALAAADAAMDQVISTPFTDNPTAAAEAILVDINADSVNDYTVNVGVPECIRATKSTDVAYSSAQLVMPSTTWNTVWMIQANVSDVATGAQTAVRSAVRVLLSEYQKNLVCP